MQLTCPKCSQKLPEAEALKYRFCPHCGAEITVEPKKLKDASLTIPPDLAPRQTRQKPDKLSSKTGQNESPFGQFNNPTIEPQLTATQPNTPPPASFFRIRAAKKPQPTGPPQKAPPKEVAPKPTSTRNRNKIIIGTLVLLAVIILILGGLFTF